MKPYQKSNDKKTDISLPSIKKTYVHSRQSRETLVGSTSRRPTTPDTTELSWSSADSETLFPSLSYKRQAQQHRDRPTATDITKQYKTSLVNNDDTLPPIPPHIRNAK